MARAGSDGQLAIDDSVAAALRRGHPWVFRDARWGGASFGAGAVVDLVGRDGAFVARGTWDPVAPIAVLQQLNGRSVGPATRAALNKLFN